MIPDDKAPSAGAPAATAAAPAAGQLRGLAHFRGRCFRIGRRSRRARLGGGYDGIRPQDIALPLRQEKREPQRQNRQSQNDRSLAMPTAGRMLDLRGMQRTRDRVTQDQRQQQHSMPEGFHALAHHREAPLTRRPAGFRPVRARTASRARTALRMRTRPRFHRQKLRARNRSSRAPRLLSSATTKFSMVKLSPNRPSATRLPFPSGRDHRQWEGKDGLPRACELGSG